MCPGAAAASAAAAAAAASAGLSWVMLTTACHANTTHRWLDSPLILSIQQSLNAEGILGLFCLFRICQLFIKFCEKKA